MVVPTDGFIIEDANSAIAIVSDTGPTSEIWRRAGMTAHLQAVFLEATFPELMGWLADVTRHLTPAMFAAEVQKLGRPARIIAVHIKPRFQEQVIRELLELKIPGLEIGRAGHPYTF